MDTYDQAPRSLSEESSRTKSKGGGFQRKYNNAIFPFFFINTDQNLRGSIPFAQIKKKNKLALALNNLKFRTIGFWLLQSSKI